MNMKLPMTSITIYYEEASDVAYFKLNDTPVVYSKVLNDVTWVDYASDESIIGVQCFNASRKISLLKREQVERELVSFI